MNSPDNVDEHLEVEEERIFEIYDSTKEKFSRLDIFLSKVNKDLSRSMIKNLHQKKLIHLNGQYSTELKLNKLPPVSSKVSLLIPPPIPTTAQPENLPLDILFEDEHLIIINKAAGMVTHPAPGNYTGTLVNAILHHCTDLQKIGDQIRPGIVHRLDKGTSGVMVVAKNQTCHEKLVLLFSTHDIKRKYEAIAKGSREIPIAGTLKSTLGRHPQNRLKMATNVKNGKLAITHYKLLKQIDNLNHFELKLETGRTHQIRVHLASLLNMPILMDPLYGRPKDHLKKLNPIRSAILKNYEHPLLHAKELGFIHPITKEELHFESSPPEPFSTLRKNLYE